MRNPTAAFYRSAGTPADFPRDGLPEVAFLGRSNVGKSSLLNALPGARDLARVSSTPGRTQTVNFYRVDEALYFADLPGYGYAKVPEAERGTWERLVRSYLSGRRAAGPVRLPGGRAPRAHGGRPGPARIPAQSLGSDTAPSCSRLPSVGASWWIPGSRETRPAPTIRKPF